MRRFRNRVAGGELSLPFALVPSEFPLPEQPIVGPGPLHRWLAGVGHEAYRGMA